jgi:hypothetical protein
MKGRTGKFLRQLTPKGKSHGIRLIILRQKADALHPPLALGELPRQENDLEGELRLRQDT